ncbi:uncharacterized protein [Prorops nasuta]|uniref:uncharacterized protein n=1 Tax=Prorops nasuta TaxID=863751 RepID=UPI0034CE6FEB
MKLYLIVVLGIIYCPSFLSASDVAEIPLLNIDIYYDVLSKRSRDFFKDQFLTSFNDVKDYVKINFIPYQQYLNASKIESSCPDVKVGCFVGEFHACVADQVDLHWNRDSQVLITANLFDCAMRSKLTADQFYKCTYSAGMDRGITKGIKNCVELGLGKTTLGRFHDKMVAVNATIVNNPTIVVNGVYSRDNHRIGRSNFFKMICDNLHPSRRPQKCSSD